MQIQDGDKFRGSEGEIYEIRGLPFQCHDQTYYPAAELEYDNTVYQMANWPESFFLTQCVRLPRLPRR